MRPTQRSVGKPQILRFEIAGYGYIVNITGGIFARVMLGTNAPDFNDTLCSGIDDTVVEVLGRKVLETLYMVLATKYGVTQ